VAEAHITEIARVQNTERSQRLLAAQSRLYTDAKRIHDLRLTTVMVLAAATIIAALTVPGVRTGIGVVGGIVTALLSWLGAEREKRKRREAVAVQEEFDTHVFDLPWNGYLVDHPSPTAIAEAATRYRGNRTKDWYPDTRNVVRPLDVLICQRSNLGWGTSMHRFYAACLTGLLVLLIAVGGVIAWAAGLTFTETLVAIVVPMLGPGRELVEMIRANRESSDTKAKADAKVMQLWERAMAGPLAITIGDCRGLQDKIVTIRQSNAHVPDWLDNLRRDHNEALMQQSADHLIEQAVQHGLTI
jgi:hypothetical protein